MSRKKLLWKNNRARSNYLNIIWHNKFLYDLIKAVERGIYSKMIIFKSITDLNQGYYKRCRRGFSASCRRWWLHVHQKHVREGVDANMDIHEWVINRFLGMNMFYKNRQRNSLRPSRLGLDNPKLTLKRFHKNGITPRPDFVWKNYFSLIELFT